MRLIISEKANTAKKIARFLSEGAVKEGEHRSVPRHPLNSLAVAGRTPNVIYRPCATMAISL